VNDPEPNLSIVTDGEGRETFIAGNKLWRQESTTTLPTYQFRTSVRAKLAAGNTATRLVWAVKTGEQYEVRTRFADPDWRAESTLWTSPSPHDATCDRGFEFGVGMIPGGRSYVAMGITHIYDDSDDSDGTCRGDSVADFLTVDRSDTVLNSTDIDYYAIGGPFQIDAAAKGPVVVTYKYDHGSSYGGDDGLWRMRFFSR
jgi:hypothetical protein